MVNINYLYVLFQENKLDIEAANITMVDKAEIESKLDTTFVNEVVKIVTDEEKTIFDKSESEQVIDYIKAIFEEKMDIEKLETDKAFLFTKLNELDERIVDFTINKFEHGEVVSDLKQKNILSRIGKLYK